MCIRDSYWATQLISMQWFHLFPQLSLGIKNWNEELVKVNKKIIYIPLQMYPEATVDSVSYTHLRAHETVLDLVCRLLLEKKKT